MLQRSAYDRLLDWKDNTPDKALLVDGARQMEERGDSLINTTLSAALLAGLVATRARRSAHAGKHARR